MARGAWIERNLLSIQIDRRALAGRRTCHASTGSRVECGRSGQAPTRSARHAQLPESTSAARTATPPHPSGARSPLPDDHHAATRSYCGATNRLRPSPSYTREGCAPSILARSHIRVESQAQTSSTELPPRSTKPKVTGSNPVGRALLVLCGSATLGVVSTVGSLLAAVSIEETLPILLLSVVGSAVFAGLFLCMRRFDADQGTEGSEGGGGSDGGPGPDRPTRPLGIVDPPLGEIRASRQLSEKPRPRRRERTTGIGGDSRTRI